MIVLPRLIRAVGDLFAAMFALQAHCAQAAAAEIGEVTLTPQRPSVCESAPLIADTCFEG